MKYSFSLLLLLSLPLFSQDLGVDFLESLDEVSEIATKTKLNIDDTPSFITVLRNDKLKKLGIKNLFEALALVPGVELKRELSGVPIVVFRGATQKGEVKLMVDGVSINNSYRGSIYYYLDFPIELIDRIEVIRGAGSVLYGSNAISGVVNIITKTSQEVTKNTVFASTGTYSSHQIGTIFSTKLQNIKLSLDAYTQKDQKTISIGPNSSGQTGDSDRHLDDYSVGVNIKGQHLSFNGRIKNHTNGNAYGIFGVLDKDPNKFQNQNRSLFGELTYKNNLSLQNSIKISLGYTNYNQKVETATSKIFTTDYKEQNYFGELNILSKSIDNNRLLMGIKFESSDERRNDIKVNGHQLAQNPIIHSGFTRKISSLYVNDEYTLQQNTNLSAGIRYDYYSDFKNSISPNLGLVYKFNERLRVKALYSHSFRAPSWIELTSNSSLEAEKSDSLETGIIFKYSSYNVIKVNLYATKIDDMITKDPQTKKYVQNTKNTFYGAELDYNYILNNQTDFTLIASYVDAKDNNGDPLPNVANVLASGEFTYELSSGFVFGSLLRYVSSSKRAPEDPRTAMDSSWIFNQTISYNYKHFEASLIFDDLFDAHTYYNISPNNYQQDFDDGGRKVIMNVSLEF